MNGKRRHILALLLIVILVVIIGVASANTAVNQESGESVIHPVNNKVEEKAAAVEKEADDGSSSEAFPVIWNTGEEEKDEVSLSLEQDSIPSDLDFFSEAGQQEGGSSSSPPVGDIGKQNLSAKCFKLHGNYCGPGWCNGKWWSGCSGSTKNVSGCSTNGSTVSPADSCCRAHDKCCIQNRNNCSKCDKNLLTCLSNAKCGTNVGCQSAKLAMQAFFKGRSKCC